MFVGDGGPAPNKFLYPFEANTVRLRPLEWLEAICLRFELYGCQTGVEGKVHFLGLWVVLGQLHQNWYILLWQILVRRSCTSDRVRQFNCKSNYRMRSNLLLVPLDCFLLSVEISSGYIPTRKTKWSSPAANKEFYVRSYQFGMLPSHSNLTLTFFLTLIIFYLKLTLFLTLIISYLTLC